MKIPVILLLLLCLFQVLTAQDSPVSPLDLGDVIIEGESDLIKDSLGTSYDLDSLLKVSDSTKFLYKPEPVVEAAENKNYSHGNKLLSLEAKAGNNTFGSLQAALSSGKILNFNLALFNRSLEEDWNELESSFNWLPGWGKTDFNLGMEYFAYRSPEIKTEAKHVGLGMSHDARANATGLNYPAINLSGFYYMISQGDIELKNVDLRSKLNWDIGRLSISTAVDYLKEKPMGSVTLYYNDLPLNQLGLYVHYKPEFYGSKEKVEISVDFYNRIKLAESIFLNISNKPYLSRNSYLDDLKNYKYQEFQENSNQYSVLLNPEISLEYFGPIYLKGYYSFSRQNDFYLFLPDSSGVYQLSGYEKVDKQEAGMELVFNYGNLELGNNFSYLKQEINERISEDQFPDYKENIPFIPELFNSTYLKFAYSNLSFRLEHELQIDRENEFGEKMKDLQLLNLRVSYNLLKQLEILAEAENILRIEYRTASYLPPENLQFKAGFRWSY